MDVPGSDVNKTQISTLVRATRFWNNLHDVDQDQKIGKRYDIKEVGSNKPKVINRIAKMFIYSCS